MSEVAAAPSQPARFAEVAVPIPLHGALTYAIPEPLLGFVQPGCRVRVPVGKRHLTGIVVDLVDAAPVAIEEVREIEDLLDPTPVLTEEMLRLAAFVSEYYVAPLGETLRGAVPARLPAWGAARLRLTRKGAFLPSSDEGDLPILQTLLEMGELSLAELRRRISAPDLERRIEELKERGLVSLESKEGSRGRYRSAVELPAGVLADQLEACGRSQQARGVVEYLASLERPATVDEVVREVSCGASVVRRLVQLRVLRSFTQLEHVPLDRHLTAAKARIEHQLTDEQGSALAALEGAIEIGAYCGFLLRGVTGSGKSEVYLRAAKRVLDKGGAVILLVPEISLVPALASEAKGRFGEELAILHSALSESEKAQEWERARSGRARVVLGPRSAVFAPVPNLGLVVVDEEHDSSFKQEHTPRYNARDLALVRARQAGAVCVLVSATPSLESRYNVESAKLSGLDLPRRVGGATLPEGILVDLRKEATESRKPGEIQFSGRLLEEIERSLAAKEQIILLRNRRGYAPVLLCRACGDKLECDDCGLPRTFHRRDSRLVCHYCGSTRGVPEVCPSCGERAFEPVGSGTERIEERIKELYPGVPIDVLDRDASRRPGGAAVVLDRFGAGETRILVGTQMVAKGHHFPGVALTAVLSADSYLGFPDFRAVERTYSLLTQLAGRAGRGTTPGRVVVQTYYPDHYAIKAALRHDDRSFAAEERRFRETFGYPPFSRMLQVIIRGRNRQSTREKVQAFAQRLRAHPLARETRISGPAPAPLERLKGYWRFQLLLRHGSSRRLRELVTATMPEDQRANVVIDVDPQDLF